MTDNGNEAAYPVSAEVEKQMATDGWGSIGVTKQEYFAGMALQGLLANNEFLTGVGESLWALGVERGSDQHAAASAKLVAKASKRFANALLVELEQSP